LIRTDFLKYLEVAQSQGDKIVRLNPLPFLSMYLVNDLNLANDICGPLANHFHKSKQTHSMVGKFLGKGLVLSEDEIHRHDRKLIAKLFAKYFSEGHIREICQGRLKRRITVQSKLNVELFFTELSFDIIVTLMFGNSETTELKNLSEALRVFADAISERFQSVPLPSWVPTKRNRQEKVAIANVSLALRNAFINCEPGSFAGELKFLLESENSSRAFVRWSEHIKTLLFAGHETVAKLMSWCVVHLVQNPDTFTEIRNELLDGSDRRLEAFLNEVLRYRAPVWLFDRTPVKNLQVGGFELQNGVQIYISPYLFHRDARYFSDPHLFCPDRFKSSPTNSAFVPFGMGVRSCIGKQMAVLEAKCILSDIIQQHDITIDLAHMSKLKPKPGATLGFSMPVEMQLEPQRVGQKKHA
jgi:cytochrome P450